MGMDKKVKVGIVGLGLVSTSHLKGYNSHPDAEVVAVCDTNKKRAEGFAQKNDIPHVYTSYEEMLTSANINTIDIATPTFLHSPMTKQAAQAGKHVHCEKPFCRYTGEGLKAVETAEKNKVILMVGETYVFTSSYIRARELIEKGEIGRPLQIRQRLGNWNWLPKEGVSVSAWSNWRIDPAKSGGGEFPWLFDHAVHLFSTAEYLMLGERVAEVYAIKSSIHRDKKIDIRGNPYGVTNIDIPIITWKYCDDACQGVWMKAEKGLNEKYDHIHGNCTTIIGDKGMIEVLGEAGGNLLWQGQQQHLILYRKGKEPVCIRFDEGRDDMWQSEISYYGQGHINQVHHFVDCILHNKQPRYDGREGVHAVRCTLAAICSAMESRPVKVDEIDRNYKAY